MTCADCQGTGEPRRIRQSLLGQVVTGGVRPVRGPRRAHPRPVRGLRRRGPPHGPHGPSPSTCRPGSRTARRCGWPTAGRPGHAAAPTARCSCSSTSPDQRFQRMGDDVHTSVHVGMAQAALGAEVAVPTLDGSPPSRGGAGHPERPRRAAQGPRRAPPARPRAGRPLRARPRDTPDRAHARSRRSCWSSWPPSGARMASPTPKAATASSPRSARSSADDVDAAPAYAAITVAAAAAQVFVEDPAHPGSTPTTGTTSSGSSGSPPANRSWPPTGGAVPGLCRFTGAGPFSRPVGPAAGRCRPRRRRPGVHGRVRAGEGRPARWVVQKLTELGVDRIVPLVTERSGGALDGGRADKAVERLRQVAREAAAQSRRPWLPEVSEPVALAALRGELGRPGVSLAERGGTALSIARPVGGRARGRMGRRRAASGSDGRPRRACCGPRRRRWRRAPSWPRCGRGRWP